MFSGRLNKGLALDIFRLRSYICLGPAEPVSEGTVAFLDDISPSGDFSPRPGKRPPRWFDLQRPAFAYPGRIERFSGRKPLLAFLFSFGYISFRIAKRFGCLSGGHQIRWFIWRRNLFFVLWSCIMLYLMPGLNTPTPHFVSSLWSPTTLSLSLWYIFSQKFSQKNHT